MPTYRYTHNIQVVFTSLTKDGKTWVPNPGDEITTDRVVDHPYLELVSPPSKDAVKDDGLLMKDEQTISAVVDGGNNDTEEL